MTITLKENMFGVPIFLKKMKVLALLLQESDGSIPISIERVRVASSSPL